MTHSVQTNNRTAPARSPGPLRRMMTAIADFFDPSLICHGCGFEDKQRRFAKTGIAHEYTTGAGWFRATTTEIEFRCPKCDEAQFVHDVRSYYPLF